MDRQFESARDLDSATDEGGQLVRPGELYQHSLWLAGILSGSRCHSATSHSNESDRNGWRQFGVPHLGSFRRCDDLQCQRRDKQWRADALLWGGGSVLFAILVAGVVGLLAGYYTPGRFLYGFLGIVAAFLTVLRYYYWMLEDRE